MADVLVSKGSMVFDDATKKGGSKIVITAKDATGAPITKAKLDTLADLILAHSKCGIKLESVLDIARNDSRTFTGNKDRKGILNCQEPDGSMHSWEIPDPIDADCEVVVGSDGEQLKSTVADTLAAGFATATGLTLVALRSPVIQKL